jgi:hypothetical protein
MSILVNVLYTHTYLLYTIVTFTVYLPQLHIDICFFQIRSLKGLMAKVVNMCCVKLSNIRLLFVSKMMDNLIF